MIIKQEIDKKKEEQIDKLKDAYTEVQQQVSELRKKGKNTRIVEVLLLDLPAKIKVATLTQQQKDINLANQMIEDIRKEVGEIVTGSEFDHITALITETFEHIRKDEQKQAQEKYRQIMGLYRLLNTELKRTVYSACIEIRKRIIAK